MISSHWRSSRRNERSHVEVAQAHIREHVLDLSRDPDSEQAVAAEELIDVLVRI